ncbi:hypothetical protein HDU97_000418 [Phlyctochytrium planicorne]|nr:hypothetical protein HDU97_000418 [Phlyctochytrium planicorne]
MKTRKRMQSPALLLSLSTVAFLSILGLAAFCLSSLTVALPLVAAIVLLVIYLRRLFQKQAEPILPLTVPAATTAPSKHAIQTAANYHLQDHHQRLEAHEQLNQSLAHQQYQQHSLHQHHRQHEPPAQSFFNNASSSPFTSSHLRGLKEHDENSFQSFAIRYSGHRNSVFFNPHSFTFQPHTQSHTNHAAHQTIQDLPDHVSPSSPLRPQLTTQLPHPMHASPTSPLRPQSPLRPTRQYPNTPQGIPMRRTSQNESNMMDPGSRAALNKLLEPFRASSSPAAMVRLMAIVAEAEKRE